MARSAATPRVSNHGHTTARRLFEIRIGTYQPVMPGLVPGIHVLLFSCGQDVDGRDEAGHDEIERLNAASRLPAAAPRAGAAKT